MTRLHLIYAQARDGVIGRGGALPWHLPQDLAHFKRMTLGAPVIMGRKTWDALPARFRPLPQRRNIVVTRNRGWMPGAQAADAWRADSLEHAVRLCADAPDAWVIGGAEMLRAALPLASSAVVTEIDAAFEGDTRAPPLGADWVETAREDHVSDAGLAFSFVTYRNRAGDGH